MAGSSARAGRGGWRHGWPRRDDLRDDLARAWAGHGNLAPLAWAR
jgi:hypothetical protein